MSSGMLGLNVVALTLFHLFSRSYAQLELGFDTSPCTYDREPSRLVNNTLPTLTL